MSRLAWRPGISGYVGAVVFVALFALPLGLTSDYTMQQLEYVLAIAMVAVGLNVVTGFGGQLALGPSGVFGLAGYAVAVLISHWAPAQNILVMAIAGMVVASIAGLIIGIPALRVGGFYLGMTTLAVALLVPIVGTQLEITGGEFGLSMLLLPDWDPALSGVLLYEITVLLLLAVVLWSWSLLNSRVGRRFLALSHSEDLAASLGASGYRTKLLAFLLSAWPTGLGAALYVYTQEFFSAGSADAMLSIYVLSACVIGGFGSILGPVLGAILVFGFSQFFSEFQSYQGIVFGVVLACFAIVWPEGVMGFLGGARGAARGRAWSRSLFAALRSRAGAAPTPSETPVALTPRPATDRAPAAPPVAASEEGRTGNTMRLVGLAKRFGGVTAIDDVDLTFEAGAVHGLIGSNGSGKTTILNMISGFYRLDAGEIWLGDTRIDRFSAAQVARAGVGRTFQTPKLLPAETLLDNVRAAADLTVPGNGVAAVLRVPAGRRSERESKERALACIEAVGLGEYAHLPTERLPHGLRRLGEIARAMAMQPRVLLLDEPAAGLTQVELALLERAVRSAADQGMAVLLIEHNVPFVFGLADEVTALHLGRVIARGTPEEIRDDEQVAEAFLGSALQTDDPVDDAPMEASRV